MAKLSDKLGFAWCGDFELLKQFVSENLKLEGTWSQPGGDKKLFTSEDLTIIWRKNKNLLSVNGKRASKIMKELCKQICKLDEDNLESPISDARQSSMKSSDICEEFENLKFGQLVNTEAIQALSGSISHITYVMSQFQTFMDKSRNDLGHGDEIRAKLINIANESFEYGNQDTNCKEINAEVDSPIVSKEFINHTVNNRCDIDSLLNLIPDESALFLDERVDDTKQSNEPREDTFSKLLEENSNDVITAFCSVSDINLTSAEKTTTEEDQATYANVVASHPAQINCKYMENSKAINKPGHAPQSPQRKTDGSTSDPVGFIGVERKRNKTKKFFVTGIADNVKESQILSYLERRKIIPTYFSIFPSQRRGTLSFKINVPSAVSSLVQEVDFWPKFVSCKPWRSKEYVKNTVERKINWTYDGNYSTYV